MTSCRSLEDDLCSHCGKYTHGAHTEIEGQLFCNELDCVKESLFAYSKVGIVGPGTRADTGKPRVDLIPAEVMIELGKLYEYGARKYDENNWRKGMNYSRMYASLYRHLLKFWAGEAEDEEGFHHLDAVIWGAVGLRYFEMHPDAYEGFDDRWPMHEMDFPDVTTDLPRDETNRVTVVETNEVTDGEHVYDLDHHVPIEYIPSDILRLWSQSEIPVVPTSMANAAARELRRRIEDELGTAVKERRSYERRGPIKGNIFSGNDRRNNTEQRRRICKDGPHPFDLMEERRSYNHLNERRVQNTGPGFADYERRVEERRKNNG